MLDAVGPDRILAAIDEALDELTVVEQAALAYDWTEWWARPKQLPPEHDRWRSWGLCTGRGFGKTRSIAEYVHREAMSGRAMRIALCAQNDDKTREVMIDGESGLLAVAPPWERPRYEKGRVLWPNGAQAFPFSPEVPGDIRGPGFDLTWCSEFVAWPIHRRDEAWSNLRLTTRLGYARVVWDTTPKRRHPIIRDLLDRSAKSPLLHIVVRGTSRDNIANISPDALEEWEAEWGVDTPRGREELLGEYIDENVGVLWHPDWIEAHRREQPGQLSRRVIAIDPAISTRKGTDRTGIVECGVGVDGQYYVLEDLSGRMSWEVWGALVVERYVRHHIDCVVVERNRGGDAVAANLRACARDRGIRVETVVVDAHTRHSESVILCKEVSARGAKDSRAEPVASLYQLGRVSHVIGADLTDLEEQMTTWEPAPNAPSPDNLDACVWAMWELAGLGIEKRDARAAFVGLGAAAKELRNGMRGIGTVGRLLPRNAERTSRL